MPIKGMSNSIDLTETLEFYRPSEMRAAESPQASSSRNKAQILIRVMKAWEKVPGLRLAQFISNATGNPSDAPIYYMEDETLARRCEEYAARYGQK